MILALLVILFIASGLAYAFPKQYTTPIPWTYRPMDRPTQLKIDYLRYQGKYKKALQVYEKDAEQRALPFQIFTTKTTMEMEIDYAAN